MLLKIAWRNIWRSRLRSLVVMGAIVIGAWAVLFLAGFQGGFVEGYVRNAIENQVSHLQVHHPGFREEKKIDFLIEGIDAKVAQLLENKTIKSATARTIVNGMLSSSKGARGVFINGVNPNTEPTVTKVHETIIDGDFLNQNKRNPILVSKKTAEKLKLKVRSKVVLTFQDKDNEILAGSFRVIGIFETSNAKFDEVNAYVVKKDVDRLLGFENQGHELAMLLNEPDSLLAAQEVISALLPDLKTETYQEISPDVRLFESQIQSSAYIILVIFMLALIFGIINTMLMAVLERTRELGMLMAVGMNKVKVYTMVVLETIMLGVIAAPLGIILAYLTINYFNKKGIDLSAYSEGMKEFGMAEMVYTTIAPSMYWQLGVAVFVTAVLASLYPAYKAISLRPVEAIRAI